MLFRKPQYRRFEYEPRFYRPELDQSEQLKRRLREERRRNRRKRRSPIVWAVLMLLLFYLYLYLSGTLR
jgi:hypothetical protein